ncbi:MAG: hypothetical protein AAGK09_15475 [Planctomycetota bacterium]
MRRRRNAAQDTIDEAKRLYDLAEQLDLVSSRIEDQKTRHEIKTIVVKVLDASNKLSSLSLELAN